MISHIQTYNKGHKIYSVALNRTLNISVSDRQAIKKHKI